MHLLLPQMRKSTQQTISAHHDAPFTEAGDVAAQLGVGVIGTAEEDDGGSFEGVLVVFSSSLLLCFSIISSR